MVQIWAYPIGEEIMIPKKDDLTKNVIMAIGAAVVLLSVFGCASTAKFQSLEIDQNSEPQLLSGKLTKPSGEGPFPAIVLLHGCAGPKEHYSVWIDRLRGWGYVTLMVDSFGPRGATNCWSERGKLISPARRGFDAHGAKLYLSSLPYVNPDKIAVMGCSHGGMTTLEAVQGNYQGGPFRAAIAFYPYCDPMFNINTPLLVLIGEKDDWTPAHRCEKYILPKVSDHEIILKVYPNAYHSFDKPYRLQTYRGH
jgi:dienelactone hydrolase